MADKKISQLTGATTPLTGTEELAIVQGGQTLKATAQDVADLAGSGFSFSSLLNPAKGTIDIINALEGTSIPDGSTATYTKTVPLPFTAPTAVFGCVQANSTSIAFNTQPFFSAPFNYGIIASDNPPYYPASVVPGANGSSPVRFVAFQNYTQSFRAQSYPYVGTFTEVDENGSPIIGGTFTLIDGPTYTELNGTMIGVYNGPFSSGRGFGMSSSDSLNSQEHSVIKAIYISGNNLVFNFKKRIATTGETWTRFKFTVYNFS